MLSLGHNELIDDKSALVQVMAWSQTSDKPLPEPMMTEFIEIYSSLGLNELNLFTRTFIH